jgi:ubiquinone/menaquinone biosynthesis C-methylase UbiE
MVEELANKATNGKVCGVDYSNEMVHLSQKINKQFVDKGKVEIKHGSVSALPFDDDMFDLATAFETTYFWPDFINDLKQIKRVLKPGGTILLVNEVYTHEKFVRRNRFINNLVAMQLHTPEEYHSLLTDAGYTDVSVEVVSEKNWIVIIAKK